MTTDGIDKILALGRSSDGFLPAYAWPGGYPLFYLTKANDCLCHECATEALDSSDDPPVAYDIHWEGPAITCDDCGEQIESAYGDPEDKEAE